MNDLKSCPFCGAIATTEVRVTQMGGETDNVDFTVVCTKCGTDKTIRLRIAKKATFLDVVSSMDKAIDAWNRRAYSCTSDGGYGKRTEDETSD